MPKNVLQKIRKQVKGIANQDEYTEISKVNKLRNCIREKLIKVKKRKNI